eukprot:TRINITY_DN24556_c0_g3_i1.p1 TRINITY_DN24556_c0_g3~~TRINITY_DN24556_c0_g3_i1.p1  ORF type:complete len:937 (-),score=84.88 TRINITY_DN24556_c0_g3_i1:320-3130(-)
MTACVATDAADVATMRAVASPLMKDVAAPPIKLQGDSLPPWPFGLGVVLGPSGSGKTRCLRHIRQHYGQEWTGRCDDHTFSEDQAIISHKGLGSDTNNALNQLQSVGLNSIPAWTRPMHVLSTGQRARACLALDFAAGANTIDDFAAVLDIVTARSTAAAIARRVERCQVSGVLVATVRPEVVPWLAPDFVVFASTGTVVLRPAQFPIAAPRVALAPHFGEFIAGAKRAEGERCGWEIRSHDPVDAGTRPFDPLMWDVEEPLKFENVARTKKLVCAVLVDDAVTAASDAFEFTFDGRCETEIPQLLASDLPGGYRIGVLIGPSGTGKSSILREVATSSSDVYPGNKDVAAALTDVVGKDMAFELLDAVALPWPCCLRSRSVLSTGEGGRADAAMALAVAIAHKTTSKVALDEWTSVLDRATAKLTCEKLSSWLRETAAVPGVVFATVHEDIVRWLKPDWAFHTSSRQLTKRGVAHRPLLSGGTASANVKGAPCVSVKEMCLSSESLFSTPHVTLDVLSLRHMDYASFKAVWEKYFEEHHYLRGDLSYTAACLIVRDSGTGAPVAFHASLPFPCNVKNAWREHRLVTRPEWQGLRIGPMLSSLAAARLHACGFRYYSTTAHPRLAASRISPGSGWTPSSCCAPDGSRLTSKEGGLSGNLQSKRKLRRRRVLDEEALDEGETCEASAPKDIEDHSDALRRRRVFSHRYVGLCGRSDEDFSSAPLPCAHVACLQAAMQRGGEVSPQLKHGSPVEDASVEGKAALQRKRVLSIEDAGAEGQAVKKRREFELSSKTWVCPVAGCGHRMIEKSAGCRAHVAYIHRKQEYIICKMNTDKAHHGCVKCVPACHMDGPGAALRYAATLADVGKTGECIASLQPWVEEETRDTVTEARRAFIEHVLQDMKCDDRRRYCSAVLGTLEGQSLSNEAETVLNCFRACML